MNYAVEITVGNRQYNGIAHIGQHGGFVGKVTAFGRTEDTQFGQAHPHWPAVREAALEQNNPQPEE